MQQKRENERIAFYALSKFYICLSQAFLSPPDVRYTNTISKASLAVYGTWFALIVSIDDYEGELYPETKQPTYKMIREWIKQRYGFSVNSDSISKTKRKCGLITDTGDTERHYIRELQPEKEAAIREALVWFGVIKGK